MGMTHKEGRIDAGQKRDNWSSKIFEEERATGEGLTVHPAQQGKSELICTDACKFGGGGGECGMVNEYFSFSRK